MAVSCLNQLAEDEKADFPLAAEIVKNEFFVGNGVTSAQSIAEAEEVISQLNGIMKGGQFILRKWSTKEPKVLNTLPSIETELLINPAAEIKILGINWLPCEDQFNVVIAFENDVCLSKRAILSETAAICDPLNN